MRGTVGVGLVVGPGQLVDEIEVVALDRVDEMARAIPVRDLLRERSTRRTPDRENAIEQVLTGSALTPAIIATTALESTPPERNAPSGTSAIIRSRTDSRRRSTSSASASRVADRIVEREADIPVFARLAARPRRAGSSACARAAASRAPR